MPHCSVIVHVLAPRDIDLMQVYRTKNVNLTNYITQDMTKGAQDEKTQCPQTYGMGMRRIVVGLFRAAI